jgi:hypothetical protein
MLPALSPAPPNTPDRGVPVGAAQAIAYGSRPSTLSGRPATVRESLEAYRLRAAEAADHAA